MNDDLPFSPAAERNQAPILVVLADLLPPTARVLEVASGTGQHARHFAGAQPGWTWQPTDGDPAAPALIARRCAGLANVMPAQHLDVFALATTDVGERFDAVFCANLLHIAPWAACAALMHGAARHLCEGGWLVTYGPYIVDGEPVSPGNLAFDADLRARNAAWGLRRLAEVADAGERAGMHLLRRIDMPANNLMLVFERGDQPSLPPRS